MIKDLFIHQQQLTHNGYTVIENVFTENEVAAIADTISLANTCRPSFRKTADLFAIRQFLKEVPAARSLIFNQQLTEIVQTLFGNNYFLVKSIYFDKPEQSNWFVAYHQDLTIAVDKKQEVEGFYNWTVKQQQWAVQPPLAILENIFTIRIHLDDTTEHNGALKVIPGSHRKGIYRPEIIDWDKETETICPVQQGGIMIMRPLLLHASGRTVNNHKRRVIHLEFSNLTLPGNLQWAEAQGTHPPVDG